MLCGLQFRRIRRQEEQVDVVRHSQALCAVPAGAIQHEHDLLARRSADRGQRRRARPRRGGYSLRWPDERPCGLRRDGRSRRDSATRSDVAPEPRGRCPSTHQTFCRMGLSPMRCSSTAHSSTVACGKAVATSCSSGRRRALKEACATGSACTWRGRGLRKRAPRLP